MGAGGYEGWSTIGRVILWIVVAVQAAGWVILLLLVGSGTSVSGTSDAPADATIEFLVPGCTGGALEDCLMLYFVTDVGSTTEQVALTCGNRVEPSLTSCAAMVKQSPDGYRPLVDQCDKGFYLACDTLPLVVPVDSAEGRLAATCGGLREPDLITPCTLDFGYGARE